jgi:hypothetical protein
VTWKKRLNSLVGPTPTPGRDVCDASVAIPSSYRYSVSKGSAVSPECPTAWGNEHRSMRTISA